MDNIWPYDFNFLMTEGRRNIFTFIETDELIVPDDMPDDVWISNEFLINARGRPWFARDGALIIVKGTNATFCYELVKEYYDRDAWYAILVKYQPS